jgi:hypothetical protein
MGHTLTAGVGLRSGGFAGFLVFEWLAAGIEIVDEPSPRMIAMGEYGQVTAAGDGNSANEDDLQQT